MIPAQSTRIAPAPSWFDSLLFLALMSGPPKFRARDPLASLEGSIDLVVTIQLTVWALGGLWVLARLYPTLIRRGVVPSLNAAQTLGALFIASLTLSIWHSPGVLLTTFTLGQFAVMLGFVWLFTHRFGTKACLQHLFIGVVVLSLAIVALLFIAPGLVTDDGTFVTGVTRLRGDYIADTGSMAAIGLVFCLSNMPPLRGPVFWGALSLFGGLLAASRTRSAYVAFLAFLAIGFIHGKRLRIRKLVPPLAALFVGVLLMDAFSSTVNYMVRERDSIETMSDRVPLWQYLTSVVMRDSPITGLGYYAASRVVAPEYNHGLGNAHSVFFEVLLGGGILGASLYVAFCASLIWFAVRLLRVASGQPRAVAATGLLVVALLMGFTSPAALHAGPLGFAFWASTALLPSLLQEAVRSRVVGERILYRRRSTLRAGARTRIPVMNRQAE